MQKLINNTKFCRVNRSDDFGQQFGVQNKPKRGPAKSGREMPQPENPRNETSEQSQTQGTSDLADKNPVQHVSKAQRNRRKNAQKKALENQNQSQAA